MKSNGACIIVTLLEQAGIRIIAGIPGGSNLPLYDALGQSGIRHVLARHEQGAGFISHGMARSSGRTAVCWATSGPGATNLLTAVADAKMDSVPVVFITGQVPSGLIGKDAFQEVDICSMAAGVTKKTYRILRAEELLAAVPEAFRAANSGRPGPVLIDVPKDIILEEAAFDSWPAMPPLTHQPGEQRAWDDTQIRQAAGLINRSRRPVIYVGGGAVNSRKRDFIRVLAEKAAVPVVSSLMGRGVLPSQHPLNWGLLGMHGERFTNAAMDHCDLLLVLGARFGDRSTGKAEEFCRKAAVVHVDIDPAEINKIRPSQVGICGDLDTVLERLVPLVRPATRAAWKERIGRLRKMFPVSDPEASGPGTLIRRVAAAAGPGAIITTDVGQHQMWVAKHCPFTGTESFLTSGGLGTMGFGLPAAIGAALEHPHRRVVCFSGDGSLLMNIQELATLAELDLDVKIVVMNNRCLGLVRQQQELFYRGRYIGSVFQGNPDLAAVARGFGVTAYSVSGVDIPPENLERLFASPGPALIDVPVEQERNCLPMVVPGAANRDMIGEQACLRQ